MPSWKMVDVLPAGSGSAVGTLLAAAILYTILKSIYNVYFHPLSIYPGPRLLAVSQLPGLYHRSVGTNHSWPRRLHDRYGGVVRIAPDELSYTDPAAWRDVYGRASNFPRDMVGLGPDVTAERGIIRAGDADHARQRRVFNNAFSERALREQEGLVRRYAALLVARLREQADLQARRPGPGPDGGALGRFDAVRLYSFTTFDIMADLTFGEPLGMLSSGEYSPWVRDTYAGIKTVTLGMMLRGFYPPFGPWLLSTLFGGSVKSREKHIRYSMDRVDRRLADDKDRGDIWSLVMRSAEQGTITRNEMYSNAQTFMIGGTETTAALLSALTYLLCQHPDKKRRLLGEIRAFASTDDLTIMSLQRLPYLNACLEEGMRLYPPAPTPMPRLAPRGGATVCSQYVPEGTKVDIPLYAMFRHRDNFADPDEFVPERWLDDAPEKYANDQRSCMKPFSYGPRDCIGQNMAYHEVRLVLAMVLWNFDISLEDPSFDWFDQQSYGIWDKNPLHVNLTYVDRSA